MPYFWLNFFYLQRYWYFLNGYSFAPLSSLLASNIIFIFLNNSTFPNTYSNSFQHFFSRLAKVASTADRAWGGGRGSLGRRDHQRKRQTWRKKVTQPERPEGQGPLREWRHDGDVADLRGRRSFHSARLLPLQTVKSNRNVVSLSIKTSNVDLNSNHNQTRSFWTDNFVWELKHCKVITLSWRSLQWLQFVKMWAEINL